MSWVPSAAGSGFDIDNLPYGVFRLGDQAPHLGVRIGDQILDLAETERAGLIDAGGTLGAATLNPFMAKGRRVWGSVRAQVTQLLTDVAFEGRLTLQPVAATTLQLPFEVADYVDFYSSLHHAANIGQLFRPGQPPLTPNWRHLPIGYHGRSGTVVVSGTPVTRPTGQRMPAGASEPVFGPSVRLDIEAEVGFVVGTGSTQGTPVDAGAFRNHVFGVVLLNDWSARDLQAWEYVPLGPFLGKSFATSISGWVTPLEALESAWRAGPPQEPAVLPYLADGPRQGLALDIEVSWNDEVVSRPPFELMYWTPDQQLAHMTINGASLRTGDLFASGTVSGPDRAQSGSFLELSWGGEQPITLTGTDSRTFLEDGDEVTLRATAPGPAGSVITLGEVTGQIRPAL